MAPLQAGVRVKRRGKDATAGVIVGAVGKGFWMVRFDGSNEPVQLKSNQLTAISEAAGVAVEVVVHQPNDLANCPLTNTVPVEAALVQPCQGNANLDASMNHGTGHHVESVSVDLDEEEGVGVDILSLAVSNDDTDVTNENQDDIALSDDNTETFSINNEEDSLVADDEGSEISQPWYDNCTEETTARILEDQEIERLGKARHAEKTAAANAEKQHLIDNGFEIQRENYVWRVVEVSNPEIEFEEYDIVGVRGIDFHTLEDQEAPFASLFMHLYPGVWQNHLKALNLAMKENNVPTNQLVSEREWFLFFAILFSATAYGRGGEALFATKCHGIAPAPDISRLGMSEKRFNLIKKHFPDSFASEVRRRNGDKWYKVSNLIDDLNINRKANVAASRTLTVDESMVPWTPRTSKTGGLPHLTFVLRKPHPLGVELKVTCCASTGIILNVEIMKGRETMQHAEYVNRYGATTGCVLRHIDRSAGCGRHAADTKSTLLLGDSWFASVSTAEALLGKHHEFVGPVKTNHKHFPKKEIEDLMAEWPSGTHLVLECLTPSNHPLVAIGYKFNSKKVLTFIATKNAGSTTPGEPYHVRYADIFSNTRVRSVKRPQVISTYFKYNNVIDVHNQARHDLLGLENHWRTRDCWFRVCTSLFSMVAVDAWHALRACVNGDDPWKKIPMYDFANRLALDFVTLSKQHSVHLIPAVNLAPLIPMPFVTIIQRLNSVISPTSQITVESVEGEVISIPTTIHADIAPLLGHTLLCGHKIAETTQGDDGKRRHRKLCKNCKSRVSTYCVQCKAFYCRNVESGRYCFFVHVCENIIRLNYVDEKIRCYLENWVQSHQSNLKSSS